VTREIVIIGCGGHGREIFGIVQAVNAASTTGPLWTVVGFVDDKPSTANRERVDRLGVPVLGPLEWLGEAPADTHIVIGVGNPATRRAIDGRIREYGLPMASVLHPLATIGYDTVAGEGLVAFAGARVTTNVTFGRHVHLNQNCTIGHDCVIEDYVSVYPLAAVSGDCHLEIGALIGASAAVLQGLRIGAEAVVGAAACVTRGVASGVVVMGVPAR
jgi:sugar O-acyltransferase (sialic acid O-acetyltransferase NeuD family)